MKRFPSTTARPDTASRVFAGILLAAVLAMLLSLSVPRGAFAQETTSGIDVGEDGVSINGGQVFAGDGCAKAGDVVVGDCEEGKAKEGKAKEGDGPSDGSGSDAGTSDDAGAEPSEDQYGGEDGSEGEAAKPGVSESTVLESTTSEDDTGGTQPQVTETTTESTTDAADDSGAGTEPQAGPAAAEDPDQGCAVEGPMGETTTTTVEEVIDGDTVETPEGTVRMIGVDTPETVDPGEPVEPGGREASEYTASELEGEEVELELGTEPEDDYGRTLAYVWTEDERGRPVMFNETLLREGLAELLIIPPNDEYERCLAAADPVPADSPPEPEISPSDGPNDSEDVTSDAPAQDQYADEEAVEPEPAGQEEAASEEAASASDDQYEEAAAEPAPATPTDEPEIQEEEIQDPEIQEPEVQETEAREPRVRSSELADVPAEVPADVPAEVPVEASAELPDDASVPTTSVPTTSAPAAPAGAVPITTLPETGGASAFSLAAGTLLVCSGLLAARLARAPTGPGGGPKSEKTQD